SGTRRVSEFTPKREKIDDCAINHRFTSADFNPGVITGSITALGRRSDGRNVTSPFAARAEGIAEKKCIRDFGFVLQRNLQVNKRLSWDGCDRDVIIDQYRRQPGPNSFLRIPAVAEFDDLCGGPD